MWKTILSNINTLILGNWQSLFFFALGALAGIFLRSCSMINGAIDTTQEAVTNAVEYILPCDEEEVSDTE